MDDAHGCALDGAADAVRHRAEASPLEACEHRGSVGAAHLEHRAEFLAEQRRHRMRAEHRDVDVEPAVTRERHLRQRREQAAVRAVVIGDE